MKIILDNKLIRSMSEIPSIFVENSSIADPNNVISFGWPALLEFISLGTLFSQLPLFEQGQPLYEASIKVLYENEETEVVQYMYDRLFVEILNRIKALPQMNAPFLLQAIKERREHPSYASLDKMLSSTVTSYEAALKENPSHAMHDLILYLAWDRMCVYVSHLFNHQTIDPKFLKSLDVLKECLVESYLHISEQGRTKPGFYRLLEALFFYDMREENLQKHSDTEWALLTQSFPVLKGQDELADFSYIDEAFVNDLSTNHFTADSLETVNIRIALAQNMVNKLKTNVSEWKYRFYPQSIKKIQLEKNEMN